jgi:hypothetical protein
MLSLELEPSKERLASRNQIWSLLRAHRAMCMGPQHVGRDERIQSINIDPVPSGRSRQCLGQVSIVIAEGINGYVREGKQRDSASLVPHAPPHLDQSVYGRPRLAASCTCDYRKWAYGCIDDGALLVG